MIGIPCCYFTTTMSEDYHVTGLPCQKTTMSEDDHVRGLTTYTQLLLLNHCFVINFIPILSSLHTSTNVCKIYASVGSKIPE